MADAKKFRFVSPGIFLNEIDESFLPAQPTIPGPVIIGRAEKGPGMIPVKVNTWSEFVDIFGYPMAGNGASDDVWRDGNYSSPTYGAFAAQAYLASDVGPVTYVRLMGTQHANPTTDSGEAGWTTTNTPSTTFGDNGGPWGLFVFPSSSADATLTGSLAAVWYMQDGIPALSGTAPTGGTSGVARQGAGQVIQSDASGQFKVKILRDTNTTIDEDITFSLDPNSDKFIRKMFNTSPIKANQDADVKDDSSKYYWLGETYERHLAENSLVGASVRHGVIMSITSGSSNDGAHECKMPYRDSHSGWFFSQNTSADTSSYDYNSMQKLFKFVGINGYGEWLQNNVKISIANIKAPSNDNVKYGTFDVILRKAYDNDLATVVVEQFSNCTLDASSPDYVGLQIGTMTRNWDQEENRFREDGDYPNRSKYIRVVLHDDVSYGYTDPSLLPFGVYGPPRYRDFAFISGSTISHALAATAPESHSYAAPREAYARFNTVGPDASPDHGYGGIATSFISWWGNRDYGHGLQDFRLDFPDVGIRSTDIQDGAVCTKNAYFGLHTGKTGSSAVFDAGYSDYLRTRGEGLQSAWSDTYGATGYGAYLDPQWVFSLDEILVTSGSAYGTGAPSKMLASARWQSGSYRAGTSWNASHISGLGQARYQNILDSKINRFTAPMFGGFDGLDIVERDPFRNSRIDDTETEVGNYTYHTVKRAINTVADAEVVECNAISMPGLTNEGLTKYLIDVCQERADAIGIIDVKNGYKPRHESNNSAADRKGNTNTVLSSMKDRNLNNSYGCAYYPWVTIRDDNTSTYVKVPPSVVALGTFANTERMADVWFAPAGFQRGGLSQGAAGVNVVGVETKLTSTNRDDLYEININPIASFPAEGIVVFGQKTLQAARSALDRINVRRLLLYVKKGISQISSTTLFQPNVEETWNGFKVRADEFLADVQVRFGIDEYKVVLDGTTTTPDLIDQNIMYAKIFIKPTRAIEFIAVDFIITRSGASFED